MKRILCAVLAAILAAFSMLAFSACGDTGYKVKTQYEKTDEITQYVLMTVEKYGEILIKLEPDCAPITVANFQKLVSERFYDGLTFHRVSYGFMIQGGDPNGNGTGGSAETIKGEFAANGVNNPLSHKRGVISMARKSKPLDSASSQFFIVHSDAATPSLDGLYAAFGEVIDGLETVDAIASCECTWNAYHTEKSTPVEKIVIRSVEFVKVAE